MGLKDYFRNKTAEEKANSKNAEKANEDVPVPLQFGPQSRNASGIISSGSSGFMDDIKHEVMVNYLFQQQQTAMMWGVDRSSNLEKAPPGSEEGVLLRKSRGHYLACPQELARGQFAEGCSALNVHV
jgi:hypothetical protein